MTESLLSSICIGIPAYRAEKELSTFLPQLVAIVPADQIVVCIDGVFDNSQAVCESFGIRTVIHEQNRGKGAALSTLFETVADQFEWIITMDADGQHLAEEIGRFVAAIDTSDERVGVVVGSRERSRSTMPLLRRFSNGITSGFLSLMTGVKIDDSQCGYRAYCTAMTSKIVCKYTRFEMESEILIRAIRSGFMVKNVPVSTCYNGEVSHISHVADTLRWIRAVFWTLITAKKGN